MYFQFMNKLVSTKTIQVSQIEFILHLNKILFFFFTPYRLEYLMFFSHIL